jgi:hypothetical protein
MWLKLISDFFALENGYEGYLHIHPNSQFARLFWLVKEIEKLTFRSIIRLKADV